MSIQIETYRDFMVPLLDNEHLVEAYARRVRIQSASQDLSFPKFQEFSKEIEAELEVLRDEMLRRMN